MRVYTPPRAREHAVNHRQGPRTRARVQAKMDGSTPPPRVSVGAGALTRLLTGAGADTGGCGAEAALLRRLRITDAHALRAAHPRLAAAVAAHAWNWEWHVNGPQNHSERYNGGYIKRDRRVVLQLHSQTHRTTRVVTRLSAAFPRGAVSIALNYSMWHTPTAATAERAVALVHALPPAPHAVYISHGGYGIETHLQLLAMCERFRGMRQLEVRGLAVASAVIAALPPSLRHLRIPQARLLAGARLAHLTALTLLDVSYTNFDDAALAAAPPSLLYLIVSRTALSCAARLHHLVCLRSFSACYTGVGDATIASAPPCLRALDASVTGLANDVRFSHLPRLRHLEVGNTRVGDAALATTPRRLRLLHAASTQLKTAAAIRHLRHLRYLDVRYTGAYRARDLVAVREPPAWRRPYTARLYKF